jgi:nucleoside-diphosphate-sugar epimerase
MKIFITGASGFIGGAAAKYFSEKGYQVYAMSRSETSDTKIKALGVIPIRTSLGNVQLSDLQGIDVIIHAAAYVEEWGTYQDYFKPNVEGTQQLLSVAKAAKVSKFIFIGSEAVLFHGQDMLNVDEHYPYPNDTPFYYSKTKQLAEKAVLSANEKGVFETISIRPRLVWGKGDQSVLPAVKRLHESGDFAWIDGGKAQTSTTNIDNLVHGIDLAVSKGKGGNAYFILDDGVRSIREFLTTYLHSTGIELKGKSIPKWLIRPLSKVIEGLWKTFNIKKTPPITALAAHVMSATCILNDQKAREELGYKPIVSFDDGMRFLQNK